MTDRPRTPKEFLTESYFADILLVVISLCLVQEASGGRLQPLPGYLDGAIACFGFRVNLLSHESLLNRRDAVAAHQLGSRRVCVPDKLVRRI